MSQTVRKKRFGGRRIRCMPQSLREKVNRLLFHGFSPIMVKKIILCLYGSNISETTIKKHRRYLYSQVNETFKDFKERNKELGHGRGGGWLPEWYLNLYQPSSETPVTVPKTEKEKETVETGIVPVAYPEAEKDYPRKRIKTLVGTPL